MVEPPAKRLKIANDQEDNLEDNFKCPVCRLYFFGKIMTCLNGHSICELCYHLSNRSCSQCRNKRLMRNYSLPQIMSCFNLEKNCPYLCSNKFTSLNSQTLDESHHLKICLIREFQCPICFNYTFRIPANYDDLKKHFLETHKIALFPTDLFIRDYDISWGHNQQLYFYEHFFPQGQDNQIMSRIAFLIDVSSIRGSISWEFTVKIIELSSNQLFSKFTLEIGDPDKRTLKIQDRIISLSDFSIENYKKDIDNFYSWRLHQGHILSNYSKKQTRILSAMEQDELNLIEDKEIIDLRFSILK